MIDTRSSLLREILRVPEVPDAIEAALANEKSKILDDIRAAARAGNPIEAAICEGKLLALEDVPNLLNRFAFPAVKTGAA